MGPGPAGGLALEWPAKAFIWSHVALKIGRSAVRPRPRPWPPPETAGHPCRSGAVSSPLVPAVGLGFGSGALVEVGAWVKARAEPDRVSGRRALRRVPWSTKTMSDEDWAGWSKRLRASPGGACAGGSSRSSGPGVPVGVGGPGRAAGHPFAAADRRHDGVRGALAGGVNHKGSTTGVGVMTCTTCTSQVKGPG